MLRAEIHMQRGNELEAAECCRRVAQHPSAEPLMRTAAMAYASRFPRGGGA